MKKNDCKILDCTLRDGGYLNNWNFGEGNILSIIEKLHQSDIDYIECGFLKEAEFNPDRTIFNSISDVEKYIQKDKNYTLMVNFGEYGIEHLSECKLKNIALRVAFKKNNQKEALDYINKLITLGWNVFANPMSTNTYSQSELENLVDELNKINLQCVTIVDTLGNMYEDDVIRIFKFFNKNLNSNIALGFHSHNSLQLSFSNTKALLKMNLERPIIIDSCLYGMGRGAGNLCTELITKYLNDNYINKYKILPLLKSIELNLKPIFIKSPWGYSTPYYIAALHGCHPNYASFLVEKGILDEDLEKILSQIPQSQKVLYDKDLVIELVNSYLQKSKG